jgi:hypothetical protein
VCARCGRVVVICTRCDRGNRYCSPECSAAARRQSMRKAGCEYQKTKTGVACHADRQRRYRARRKLESMRDASGSTWASAHVKTAIGIAARTNEAPAAGAPMLTHTDRTSETVPESSGESPHGVHAVAACAPWPPGDRPMCCDFCKCLCDPPARRDFIRRRGLQKDWRHRKHEH